MKNAPVDDGKRLPDALWADIERLLPARPPHPLGCHNPRIPDRTALDGILFVLRSGCRWNALGRSGICTCSSAYRRFREWRAAGLFVRLERIAAAGGEALNGIDWSRMGSRPPAAAAGPRRVAP